MALNGSVYVTGIEWRHIRGREFRAQAVQIEQTLNRTNRVVQQTGSSFKNLAGAFTGLWAGRLVAGALQSMIAPSTKMETAMARLSTLTGRTGIELDAFKKRAMGVAAITTFGPVELADALTRLQQVTGNASSAMAALQPTAQLAMASFGRINLTQAVEMMGYLVKGFNLTGEEAQIAAQRVFTASKELGVGIESYAKVMDRLASAARIGGQSFDETVKVFGLLSREMHSSESAATALRRSMQYLGEAKGQQALREMGLVVTGKAGGLLPMHKIIEDLAQRIPKDTQRAMNLLTQAVGKKAAPAMLSIIGQYRAMGGAAGWDKLSAKMMSDTGALQEASEKWMNTYAGQAELLKDAFENLAIVVGDKLLPAFKDLTSGFRSVVNGISYLINETWLGAVIGPAAKATAAVAGIWALKAAGQGLFRIFGAVTGNIAPVTGAIGGLLKLLGGGATLTTGLGAGILGVVKALGHLALRLGGLFAIFYALKKMKEYAEGEERDEPLRNIMARKILSTPGTSEAERSLAEQAKGSIWEAGPIDAIRKHAAQAALKGMTEGSKTYLTHAPWLIGTATKQTPAMAKIVKEMRDKWHEAQVEPASEVKSIYDGIKKVMNETGELSVKAAGQVYGKFVLGSEEMEKVTKRLMGIATYEPPLIKMATFQAMRKQISAAMGTVKGEDQTFVGTALRQADLAEQLITKSKKTSLAPEEVVQLQNAVTSMGVAGSFLWRQYGPGIMSHNLFKRFGKDVASQVGEFGSAQNVEYWRHRTAMAGGAGLPGYIPGAGYGPADAADLALFAGTLPKPRPVLQSAEDTFTGESGSELTGQSRLTPGMAHDFDIRRWADPASNPAWQEIKQVMKEMKQALQQTLKVEVVKDGREPMGSTWGFTGES